MGNTLVDSHGRTYDVADDQLAGALAHGLTQESDAARTERLAQDVQHETYGGVAGGILSGAAGFARGASFGLSDQAMAAYGGEDATRALRGLETENPLISSGSQIAGALAGSELGGINAAIGSKVAGLAEGGVIARAGGAAIEGAAQGALQNAGAYISDTALGDRALSADGFIGAMGQGALWGGVAGGALSLSSSGLTAARRLFPAADMTAEGAQAARSAATSGIKQAVDDSAELTAAAQTKLSNIADQEAAVNPSFKQQRDAIRLQAEQDMAAARVQREQLRAEGEAAKNKIAQMKAEKQAAKAAQRGKPSAKSLLDDLSSLAEESVPAPSTSEPSLLERQLAGTKQLVDQGKSIAEIGEMRPNVIGKINDALAAVNPDAAKLNDALKSATQSSSELSGWLDKYGSGGEVGKFERNQATRDVAAGWRNKGEGWQSQVPAGEGNIGLARGTQSEWRGSEAGRAQWEKDFEAGRTPGRLGGISSDEQSMADSAIDDMQLRRMGRGGIGDQILGDEPPSAKIERALKAKPTDINDDIAETAPMITKHEAAHADLAEALGPDAPPSSANSAQQFRLAQEVSSGKAQGQVARLTDALSKLPSIGSAGATYEALRMMGVPLPDPHAVPVIGPLLSMYLKAKVLGKAFGRFGGKVGETAETVIASKAAQVRQQVYKAVDAGLAGGATATAEMAKRAGLAAILGHKLFDGGTPPTTAQPYSSEPAAGSLEQLYQQRAAEIHASQQPNAIAEAVQKRVQASDPDAVAAIVATKQRQLAYIASKMPMPTDPPAVLSDRMWFPAKQDLAKWATVIAATDDPAGVMTRAVHGMATADEIDAVRAVYPSLYADAQKRAIDKIATGEGRTLSTTQKSALSRALGLPLDGPADRGAWLQAGYQQPQPMPAAGAAPAATISGPMNIGSRTLNPIDSKG